MKKIFITAGSDNMDYVMPTIDRIIGEIKNITSVAQIGNGKYIPQNIKKYFRYDIKIIRWYKWADLVISTPGAGTLFKLLEMNKPIITFLDARGPLEKGSLELPKKLASEKCIIAVTSKNHKIKELILDILSKRIKLKRYKKPECNIQEYILKFVGDNCE